MHYVITQSLQQSKRLENIPLRSEFMFRRQFAHRCREKETIFPVCHYFIEPAESFILDYYSIRTVFLFWTLKVSNSWLGCCHDFIFALMELVCSYSKINVHVCLFKELNIEFGYLNELKCSNVPQHESMLFLYISQGLKQ